MKEYKACEVVLSYCAGDGDNYHYGSHYDDCQDCHLSIHDFDEPDDYELYHDLHGSDGCGEYCVSHGDINAVILGRIEGT